MKLLPLSFLLLAECSAVAVLPDFKEETHIKYWSQPSVYCIDQTGFVIEKTMDNESCWAFIIEENP